MDGKTSQWVKALAVKPKDQNLISLTYMVEKVSQILQVVDLWNSCEYIGELASMCVCVCARTYNYKLHDKLNNVLKLERIQKVQNRFCSSKSMTWWVLKSMCRHISSLRDKEHLKFPWKLFHATCRFLLCFSYHYSTLICFRLIQFFSRILLFLSASHP